MRVLLPCAANLPERAPALGASARANRADGSLAGNGRVVLVVDDEALVRRSTKNSLERRGFRVIEAADGPTALRLYEERKHEIVAVVLDMIMPGMRGGDVYLALREAQPDVRVLLVSGSGLDAEAKSILALGVSGFLAKPYADRELAAGLERVGVR